MRVTAIAGGTGAAKLLRGLVACLPPRDLTVVGNTGDDTEVWGLHVSPDLDTLTYALAGRLDGARGWGLADETFRCLEGMAELGAETWFNLGDRDLATHIHRTRALRAGTTLAAVTAELARRRGVAARILPMSDAPVRTRIRTPDGWLTFQEYFVREKALAEVLEVEYAGAAAARPAPGVARALRAGTTLAAVTAELARRRGVAARILPMSDAPVRTRIRTPDGWLTFQEYFVREKALAEVLEVEYAGAAAARPAPGVAEALREADLVVVCPSNPVTSVGPVLAVPGVVEALGAARGPVVAVSPIVGGAAVSGPAAALMRARGLPVSPLGVARAYAPWLRRLVIDRRDAGSAGALAALGVTATPADVVMTDGARAVALARVVLGA
ncbi:MAG: hypothetical protein A3D33_01620 [Candidatus Rokubacteria bacterium RIFCSPHIGHO2_02_FULL_73_26]|nr:MAG: hypothetical protein A3D33_01620 [Candidatus Rokubacteria bacterium RIFCSPHIGHO2_02_FULL_73_26]